MAILSLGFALGLGQFMDHKSLATAVYLLHNQNPANNSSCILVWWLRNTVTDESKPTDIMLRSFLHLQCDLGEICWVWGWSRRPGLPAEGGEEEGSHNQTRGRSEPLMGNDEGLAKQEFIYNQVPWTDGLIIHTKASPLDIWVGLSVEKKHVAKWVWTCDLWVHNPVISPFGHLLKDRTEVLGIFSWFLVPTFTARRVAQGTPWCWWTGTSIWTSFPALIWSWSWWDIRWVATVTIATSPFNM